MSRDGLVRNSQWQFVFEWFQQVVSGRDITEKELLALYNMLNAMRQQELQPPEWDIQPSPEKQFLRTPKARESLHADIEQDAEFKTFMRELDGAFRGRQ